MAVKGAVHRRYGRPGIAGILAEAGLADVKALSSRALGEMVTDHRSSWVRRVQVGPIDAYIKTYAYSSLRDKLRGAFRTTVLAPSRAAREWDALHWMHQQGLEAPAPLLLAEERAFGVLSRAVLVTETYPGTSLDILLPQLERDARDALLAALEATVQDLHDRGFRDRNLDARNLVAQLDKDGHWRIAKIDSPRFVLIPPRRSRDRLARADWDRLARSLDDLQLPR